MKDSQLNVYNLDKMRRLPPERFEFLRFDPNNNCNVRCVYCHNHRSSQTIAAEELRAFLDENVKSVENFQFGCIMEPTLDRRLAELMEMVAGSRARPRSAFILQTNGTMLHMHDQGRMVAAGLNQVSVSIDAADAATHKALRGGTSIAKVTANLEGFHRAWPEVEIHFITTVTRLNLHALHDLVAMGLAVGAKRFVMREVFYMPDSDVVDHSRMPELVLRPGEFRRVADELRATYGGRAELWMADNRSLERDDVRIRADSFR